LIFTIPDLETKILLTAVINENHDPQLILIATRQKFKGTTIQFLDLDKTAGHRHILLATYNALKSYRLDEMISRSIAIEILLYVAAERQIAQAFARIGVQTQTKKIVVIATSESSEVFPPLEAHLSQSFNHECNDRLLDEWTEERSETVRELFKITDKEIKAVTRTGDSIRKSIQRLAIERSALLVVKK